MVFPAFGVVYAKAIEGFSYESNEEKRFQGDRNALWFFIIAILSTACVGLQNYYFAAAATHLTARLRSLSFKAILRQDIAFFDKDENSVRLSLVALICRVLNCTVLSRLVVSPRTSVRIPRRSTVSPVSLSAPSSSRWPPLLVVPSWVLCSSGRLPSSHLLAHLCCYPLVTSVW